MEQLLSVVKRRTEIKFLIMLGNTKTLERTSGCRIVEKECDPVDVTGSEAPLPTMIDEGLDDDGGVKGVENTSIVDHVSTRTGVSIPFGWWRRRQRHGVEVADESGRVPRRALHGRPVLLLLLWWRWRSVAKA
jgi:hypothetical protein